MVPPSALCMWRVCRWTSLLRERVSARVPARFVVARWCLLFAAVLVARRDACHMRHCTLAGLVASRLAQSIALLQVDGRRQPAAGARQRRRLRRRGSGGCRLVGCHLPVRSRACARPPLRHAAFGRAARSRSSLSLCPPPGAVRLLSLLPAAARVCGAGPRGRRRHRARRRLPLPRCLPDRLRLRAAIGFVRARARRCACTQAQRACVRMRARPARSAVCSVCRRVCAGVRTSPAPSCARPCPWTTRAATGAPPTWAASQVLPRAPRLPSQQPSCTLRQPLV